MANCGCNDYSRTQLLRRAAAEAGAGPAGDRAGHAAAGRHGPHAALVRLARDRAGAVGVRRGQPRPEGVRARASRPPPRRRPRPTRSSCRSSSRAAPTRSRCSRRRARTRSTRAGGRRSRCPPARAPRSPRTRRCASTRRSPGIAELYGEGKVTVMPAIGYDDANQSHFTSRHYWEVGEVNPFGRWGWLGRYLDHHGVADNPLQGLTLGWDLQPALAAHDVPVATVGQPDNYDFWTPGVWGDGAGQDARRVRRPRRPAHERRRPRAGARGGRGHRAGCATSSRRSRTASRRPPA